MRIRLVWRVMLVGLFTSGCGSDPKKSGCMCIDFVNMLTPRACWGIAPIEPGAFEEGMKDKTGSGESTPSVPCRCVRCADCNGYGRVDDDFCGTCQGRGRDSSECEKPGHQH